MNEVYRITVSPYHYDTWDIFTKDKEIFDKLSQCYDTDKAAEVLGQDTWEELVDSWYNPGLPYVVLGETTLKQRD